MNRVFSIIRRRPHIVDLVTPFVYGVAGYRIKTATTFDAAAPATAFTSTNIGFIDSNVNQMAIDVQNLAGRVRMVFDPTTYSIDDNLPQWLWLYHVAPGGAETLVSAATLLLPDASQFLNRGQGHIIVSGNAPVGATIANSLQLDFPRLMKDWRVHNKDTTNPAYIAFEEGGSEFKLPAPSAVPQFSTFEAISGSCWIRGTGAVVPLSISATVANPL
jgi:hypothetical protein